MDQAQGALRAALSLPALSLPPRPIHPTPFAKKSRDVVLRRKI